MNRSAKLTALVLALVLMTSILTSCKKTPSGNEAFRKTAASYGYDVIDISDQYTKAEAIKTAIVAAPKNRAFQIEFYMLTDMESAVKIYNAQSDILESQKAEGSTNKVSSGRNYAKRTVTSGGNYMIVEYVENTIIYIPPTKVENKKDVDEFLKKFRY